MHLATPYLDEGGRRKEEKKMNQSSEFEHLYNHRRRRWAIGYGYYIIFFPSLFLPVCCCCCCCLYAAVDTAITADADQSQFCFLCSSPERNSHHPSCAVVLISIANSPARFDVEQRRQTVEGRIQEGGKGVSIYGIRCCCPVHLYNRVWKE